MKRQRAKDLTTAIAIAESLVDLRSSSKQEGDKSKSRPKEKKFKKKKTFKREVTQKSFFAKPREEKTRVETKHTRTSTRMMECFLCSGPHLAQECLR